MKDLTGKKFGRLTALYPTGERLRHSMIWHCKCDCGNECDKAADQLRGGYVKSCGCLHGEVHALNLTGKRFGNLTALNPTAKRKGSSIVWHCQCDCGNTREVSVADLKNGDVTACSECANKAAGRTVPREVEIGRQYGSLTPIEKIRKGNTTKYLCECTCGNVYEEWGQVILSERSYCNNCAPRRFTAPDISGQTFGEVKVLERIKNEGISSTYKCLCSCGKEFTADYKHLVDGYVKTCGHSREILLEKGRKSAKEACVNGTNVFGIQRKNLNINNKSGYRGVSWHSQTGKWRATIMFQRHSYYLGVYDKVEDAAAARKVAEKKIFGNFLDWYYSEHPEKKRRKQDET